VNRYRGLRVRAKDSKCRCWRANDTRKLYEALHESTGHGKVRRTLSACWQWCRGDLRRFTMVVPGGRGKNVASSLKDGIASRERLGNPIIPPTYTLYSLAIKLQAACELEVFTFLIFISLIASPLLFFRQCLVSLFLVSFCPWCYL
jgi:hypothetical protein